MPNTISYNFGDIILVPFPFTDQSTTKRRPAVVVHSEDYDLERPDLILMPVTSQLRAVPVFGEVRLQQWRQAGLIKASVVKPVLATIERSLVLRKLGRLDGQDQDAVRETLWRLLGLRPSLVVEVDHEDDGRWMAEIGDLPGVAAYGTTREEALFAVQALALRVLAEKVQQGEDAPHLERLFLLP